ncbi:vacuolar basic amino acid transporter [Acrasis kona]|uniref:Vacuolar basic amino acid transporter n=1 Tax=Acrasis kona TaxID=1008807 RepID=A0AAW2YP21_9EUKA
MERKEEMVKLLTDDQDEPIVTWREKFLGIIQRGEGTSNINLLSYYFATLISISLFVYINANQRFVLTNYINTPEDEIGRASGDLAFYNELVIILVSWGWGYLSDAMRNRSFIYSASFILMAIGIELYPTAPNFGILVLFRVIFALGAAANASMLTAVLADSTSNRDRGRATGLLGVTTGLGAVIASLLFLKISNIGYNAGLTLKQAGYISYSFVALLSVVAAFVVLFGLKDGISTNKENEKKNVNLFQILKQGIVAAKDPLVLLSYAASFVARGDSVLITTFITLWVGRDMELLHGADPSQSAKMGGIISGVAQTCALCSAPFWGFLADNVSRVSALIAASIISGIGYTSMIFISDVTYGIVYLPICLIGIGEIGVIIGSQILVTQSAPKEARGGVSGIFSLCGAFGILIATKVGGILFDKWRPGGTFVLFGIFNFLLSIIALIVLVVNIIKNRRQSTTINHE